MKKGSKFMLVMITGGILLFATFLILQREKPADQIYNKHGLNMASDNGNNTESVEDDLAILEGEGPLLGDPNAPVTLIEFGDYQCTFCTRFFKETETILISKYVDTGKLKIIFRNLPINGKESQNAANAAACSREQNKFWEYHDKLYNKRRGYNVGVFIEDNLVSFAEELGLDIDLFKTCYDDNRYKDHIASDIRDGTKFGARGTPTFFINGRLVAGAQPLSVFENLIEEALAGTIK